MKSGAVQLTANNGSLLSLALAIHVILDRRPDP